MLSRSTALLPERDAQRLELLCELGVALTTIGESAEAETVLRQACELGDRRIELRAELERALITSLAGSQDAARLLELADAGLPVFEAVGDDRALGRALMLAGWVRGGAFGLRAEWESAAEQALVHYRRAGWPATTCIGHIAAALYLGPTPAAIAIARCTQLLESGLEDLAGEASVSAHLGGLLAMTGDFLGGATHLERARGLYTELGRRPALLATCAPIEAYVARLRGEPEEAADVYRRSCEELQRARSGFHLATQAADLADVLCELGHLKDAEKWCTTAEQHARADVREGQLSFRIPRSRLWARDGKMHEAEEVARAAIRLADSTDDLNRRAATRLALVEVLELDGRARDAEPELQTAADLYRDKGNSAALDRLGRRSTAAAVSSGSTT